jgi:hypothetical protein
MKRISISILSFFIFYSSFSQINHIELLIGKLDSDVTSYFDSLNSLKSNPYYKIKRDVSDYGDMILKVEFALADGAYYTCSSIITRFVRLKGDEFCDRQYIMGSAEFAKPNLDFIKDNFKFVPEKDNWEKILIPDHFKVIATFEKKEEFYTIRYELEEIK